MDPDALLKEIQDFLDSGKTGPEVDAMCEELRLWLSKGGFNPHWNQFPLAESYYDCFIIQRGRSH